ncbi:hypothetical protein QYE76_042064 [Lolium multiflorum]|uniref:CCHC-type domain-containing protein n=1 Tax=Lolium multiflorum TaxID=4521 RepID=A0AAD8TEY6_LOLMU|nr:hypothetical protein QYE76_042064 [Lolium multiflorum]
MSITLGAATKLLDDMMINYSEWHTERAPQGKKVNSVEETSSLSDKIDVIMSMLVNGRSNVDPNNVPLASLVAQEENVDVNFIKNNNFNNNAYRNNSGNNYRPYPSANGNGYGNSYGNSYNNNRNVPSGLEAMLKEFISTQTAFNKSVEEKLDKIDTIASRVDRLASDVNLLKLKVMPNNDLDNKITTTANAIQVRINENIRLMAELRARWDREENEKLAKENNVAKVWTITTTSNANSSHVAAPPTINGKIIGVGNVSTPSAKRTKLPEIAKTAETACDKTAEIFSNLGNNDPIAVAHNDLDFDDCHISEVIKFLQKLAKSPNASAINLAFTKHITNALIKAREEKLKLETSIPRKLEDGWEPIIKMKFNDFECNALCDLGASISVMPKKIYDMLDLPPLKNCYLDVNLADNVKKKPLGRIDNVHITVNNNLVPVDFVVLDIECNASCPIVLGRPFLRTVGAVIDMREGSFQGSREENDILRSRGVKALSLGMPPWFIPAYFKKTQASKLGDAQGIPFFIDNIIRREMNHIATGTAPSLNGELLPPHGSSSGDEDGGGDGSGVDGEAFRGTSPSRGVPEQRLVPDLGFAMAAALEDMASPINFNQFLEKEKLKSNGSNFTDWFRHVRIFLNGGNLQYVLDAPLGDPPAETETDEVKNVYATRKTRYSQVQCAILCSLEADLQKRFEHHDPHELINELKTIFETHAAVECYEASKHFFSCMMEEGSSVSEHMLAMTGHAKKLSDLGIVIPNRLGINRVLQSLPPSYKNFVMNYNMQNMNKELPELFAMLKSAEIEIKKEHQVLMVNKTTSFKKQGKSKGKNKKSGKKAATPPVKPKTGPKPDAECYYCKEKGHWKRNCSKYLADLKSGLVKKKKEEFLTKEVTGRKVELDEIEESLLVDQSSAVPEDVPVPPTPATEEANDNDHETSNEIATEPRRSTRERATPDWYDPCLNVMIVDNNDEDPATYEEAMMSPDSNKWQEAMKSEMGSMYDNKVWTLVDLPDSRKAVENKWIFKRKTDADGNITVYKARLVAKGFRQIQGVDYDETFSPVAKLKSVRILLAIAAFFDYEIWQMDVKTAFLNGDIEEELYMVQPKGFVDPKNADKVCKLQRSIYGLKQASRSWNRRFDKVIKDFGFIQCHGEACIYKKVSGSSVAFLILYVDDILLIGNDIELLSSVKGYLNNSFSMKDLGEASYILGIKIYRDRSRRLIGLSQSTYLDKILKKFRMDESKKGFLPMLPGKVLSKTQGPATAEERERMSQIPYASAVGSIMYAMLCTRPDIAHAVSLTSRYQSDPGMEHWTAVKNILKYLKRTKDMFLCYGGDQELVVTSYTDASWNTDPDDSKSQSGYVFILNGAAVSWASSKQCTVAKSSTESEYIAASEASSEAVWMKRFIVELGVVPSALDPLVIYCDNMGAIANAQEPRSHKRLKHIKLRYHSIREYIEDGEVKICKVHTDLNVADPLTKALPRAKHDQHQNAMGVRYLTM